MSGITGFVIAVGIVSVIIFMLMSRAERIGDRRRAHAGSSTSDTSGISSSTSDGFSLLNWFGSSSSSSPSGDSCTSSSSFFGSNDNSSDSGCSDGGGGGGDGGGGGSD
ncbi:MAG: hypothetical protein GY844_12710 [Bradyrhizobium sp.]|nr:hypothetical protein [Bradyrhizobium sp.]